jgi:hypothetical protein
VQLSVNLFRSSASESGRPMAVRTRATTTTIAITVALAVSALASMAFTVALHDTFTSGLVTFAMFGSLAALSAGVLAWEVASRRVCPRCGTESGDPASCTACGYDLRARPRFACTEGHHVAYEAGLCDCGRRLLPLRPVAIAGRLARTFWLAVVFFLAFLLLDALLSLHGNG